MRNLKRLIMFSALMLVAAGFVCPDNGFAFGRHRMDHSPAWSKNITPEQNSAAHKLLEESWNATSATREALSSKYSEMNALLNSENPDASRIESLSREIGEFRGKMLEARVKVRSELSKLGLPSDYYAYHDMRGHQNGWHRVSYGGNHRMENMRFNGGNRFNCWNN